MTVFGWDASHYDGLLSTSILSRARSEGIQFFTHKIAEGTGYEDPNDLTALAAARDAGIECIGGYHVVRSVDAQAQVNYLIAQADRDEPWWRGFPHWFWQIDLERWAYDNVSAASGVDVARRLRDQTQRQVVIYASQGQYGDQLAGWDGPLWNADYTGNAAGGFAAMYPGDGWAPLHGTWRGGWADYSGLTPAFLQYTSSATIAGLTTCDANAFRGSLDQLKALIAGGDMPTPQEYAQAVWEHPVGAAQRPAHFYLTDAADMLNGGKSGYDGRVGWMPGQISALGASAAADAGRDAASQAAVAALQATLSALADTIKAGGGSVDVAAIGARIDAAVAQVRADVFGKLAAAAKAEADTLAS